MGHASIVGARELRGPVTSEGGWAAATPGGRACGNGGSSKWLEPQGARALGDRSAVHGDDARTSRAGGGGRGRSLRPSPRSGRGARPAVCVDPVGRVVARRRRRTASGSIAQRPRRVAHEQVALVEVAVHEHVGSDGARRRGARARSGPTRAAAARRVPRALRRVDSAADDVAQGAAGRTGAGTCSRSSSRATSARPRRPLPAHRARCARAAALRVTRPPRGAAVPGPPSHARRDAISSAGRSHGAGELQHGVGAVRPAHEPDERQQPAAELRAGLELPALARSRPRARARPASQARASSPTIRTTEERKVSSTSSHTVSASPESLSIAAFGQRRVRRVEVPPDARLYGPETRRIAGEALVTQRLPVLRVRHGDVLRV